MALLGFKQQFVPKIKSGFKRHTIRATRARPFKVGETLHLYTGLRQKGAQLIFRSTCTKIQTIEIAVGHFSGQTLVWVDGVELSDDERESLAQHDGFDDFAEMTEFWEGRLPFTGVIVHWAFPPDK